MMGRIDSKLGQIERHFWLTRSVARMIGVNLSDAMAEGRLSEDGYCNMVTRCRSGGCSSLCERWLACQPGQAEAAPEHCANADILNRLRHGPGDRRG